MLRGVVNKCDGTLVFPRIGRSSRLLRVDISTFRMKGSTVLAERKSGGSIGEHEVDFLETVSDD